MDKDKLEESEATFDPNTEEGAKILQLLAKQEATIAVSENGAERKSLVINPDAQGDMPKVTGERVPEWKTRSLRSIRGVAGSQSNNHSTRQRSAALLVESDRQFFAMADSQREDEMKIATNIAKDAMDDKRIDAKAYRRIVNLLDDQEEKTLLSEKRTHSTLTGPAGEFLVPKPMLATIFTHIEEYGLAFRLGQNINLTSKDLELNSIATAPTATWVGETERFTESDMVLGQNVLTTSKLGAVSSISMEQEEDQITPLIPMWLAKVGENIALELDQSFFHGDGTATFGQFIGITNAASVNTTTLGASDLNFSNVVEGDFRTTRETLSVTRRSGARWVMHRGLWNVAEQFESSVGARIVQSMLTAEAPRFLLGHPVELSEAFVDATADVANVDFAILGNFNRTLVGQRRGITVETSTDAVLSSAAGVVTTNAFQQDIMLVKISIRVGHQTPTGLQDGYAVMNAPAS